MSFAYYGKFTTVFTFVRMICRIKVNASTQEWADLPDLFTLWAFIIPDGGLLERKRTPGDLEICLDSGVLASYSCAVNTGENG